jgi:Zn-finger nucleic acid-binding protein
VWLDRGELDKIIERSVTAQTPAPMPNLPPNAAPGYGYPQNYPDHHDQHGKHGQHGYQRRKSWLGELFD